MNTIGAIRIVTNVTGEHYPEIGLYSEGANPCEIRLSESEMNGLTVDYSYDLLLKNGIGPIVESFGSSQGGNTVDVNDFTFSIAGTNQAVLRWQELGITLVGLSVQYIEFVGTDAQADSESTDVLFVGTIESIRYNQFSIEITSKTSFYYKRNKLLSRLMTVEDYPQLESPDEERYTPVSFGSSDPESKVWFKLIRCEYENMALDSRDIIYPSYMAKNLIKMPVIFDDGYSYPESNAVARVLCGIYTIPGANTLNLSGKYLKVLSGSNGAEGEIRKIDTSGDKVLYEYETGDTEQWYTVRVAMKDVFSRRLAAYGTGGDNTYKAFVSVISMLFRYCLDHQKCYSTLPESFYIKNGESMNGLNSVDISQLDTDLPQYDFAPPALASDGESYEILTIIPITSFELLSTEEQNLVEFGVGSDIVQVSDGTDMVPGVYATNTEVYEDVTTLTETAKTFVYDKDFYTCYEAYFNIDNTYVVGDYGYLVAIEIFLPAIPDDIEFESVHLGVCAVFHQNCNPSGGLCDRRYVKMCRREMFGEGENFDEHEFGDEIGVFTLPDNYFTTPLDTGNVFRYQERTIVTADAWAPYSLNNFNLNIDSVEKYRRSSVVLMFRVTSDATSATDIDNYLRIYELAVVFKNSASIQQELYA